MAAAYASLVSLMNIIDQIMYHGRNSFSLNHEQIESLRERAAFLEEFLECYSHGDNKEVEDLESQIADASHAAEDLIESKVVDYIHDHQSTNYEEMGCNHLCQPLQKVIQDIIGYIHNNPFCQQLQEVIEVMDLMKKKAMEIKEKGKVKDQLPKDSIPSTSSSFLPVGKDTMVGFDDILIQIMDRLTRQQSNVQIIPISGMGGIGKTTLTRNVYENPYIVQHFHIRAWVTISQEYEIKEILLNLLIEFGVLHKETAQGMNEGLLGEKLHKYLFGRKYLIVMDDMWSINVWEEVSLFFPDNVNGSGIIITTRLSYMASHLGSCGLEVDFLNKDQSWNLLRKKVFDQQECTLELEEIGKKIAKNCKGLPLSIVVIAGILAKSNMTREYWDHVANKVNSIVSIADDGQCSKILSLSYINMPVHLKPCFLYMGVFPEDHQIRVSRLIKLWVAEGLLKPNRAKSLEEVAEEYLMDLIDRNLIMVHKQGLRRNVKICKIHDLLRDLCIREAQKEKFLCVIRGRDFDSSQALHNQRQRRVVIDGNKKEKNDSSHFNNQGALSVSLPRSITFNTELDSSLLGCRLIRVLNGDQPGLLNIAYNLVNLRYFFENIWGSSFKFPSTINLIWNLQTLILGGARYSDEICLMDIWEMKHLRYLNVGEIFLPEPPPLIAAIDGGQKDSNMKHLQTLKTICDITFSEGVVRRIPNIKQLHLVYNISMGSDRGKDHCLNNLQYLQKLESLRIVLRDDTCSNETLKSLIFPNSLKKLSLEKSNIPWEHMTIIGCLPNLEVLKLENNAFIGEEWNPIKGQFLSLKYLKIQFNFELKSWNADSSHFPVLEILLLDGMRSLEEIPLGIGEIPTLQSIQLVDCRDSTVSSAMVILDEQESQGNADIKVEVWLDVNTQLQNLEASDNIMFHYMYDFNFNLLLF